VLFWLDYLGMPTYEQGVDRKFRIRLEKTVPAQAGLGGGSGNAATTLWGCNELCKANDLKCVSEEVK